jgi:hypothetical protein
MQNGVIQWSGSDSSVRQRGSRWYLVGIGLILLLSIGALLINLFLDIWQIWSTVGLALIIFIGLIISNRSTNKRAVSYELSESQIVINGKPTPLGKFRAFSVSNNQGTWLVSLIPAKRIAMSYDLVVPQEMGEQIVDFLGELLPMEKSADTLSDRFSSALKI